MKWLHTVITTIIYAGVVVAAPPGMKQYPGMHGTNYNKTFNGNGNSNINKNSLTNDITIKLINRASSKTVAQRQTRSGCAGFINPISSGFAYGLGSTGFNGGYSGGYGSSSPSYAFNPYYDMSGLTYSQSPSYAQGGAQSNSPMPNESLPGTASLTIETPHELSEVFLNETRMNKKGLIRKFTTPPLEPDKTYSYEVKVNWPGGKSTITIDLKAGDNIYYKVLKDDAAPPMPKLKAIDPNDQAEAKLKLALQLWEDGKLAVARERLLELIEKFPGTEAANKAKQKLLER